MDINSIQDYYNRKMGTLQGAAKPAKPEPEADRPVVNTLPLDMKDLVDRICLEYSRQVRPLLEKNEGQLEYCTVPVIREILKSEVFRKDKLSSMELYLFFRLQQLNISKTNGTDDDVAFKELR